MSEEEKKVMKNDILFQIDMQLYDEFNDTLATMNDHLGDIYTLRDVEEVEQAEKAKEIKLLREAVKIQQKELNQEKEKNKKLIQGQIETLDKILKPELSKKYISKDKIREKIEELENDEENIEEHNCLRADTCYVINILQELLEE